MLNKQANLRKEYKQPVVIWMNAIRELNVLQQNFQQLRNNFRL